MASVVRGRSITVASPPPAFTDLRIPPTQRRRAVSGSVIVTQAGSTFTARLSTVGRRSRSLGTVVKRRRRAGVLDFTLKLSHHGATLLARTGELKLRVEITVALKGGSSGVATRTVTLRWKRVKR